MKMAELERRSGVGRETIRFYIREGLLPEPERRARNVADYGAAHVERLKQIKTLQEERFLPLDVIKRVLDGDLSGLPAAVAPFPDLGAILAGRLGIAETQRVPLTILTKGDPATAADIAAFRKLGVVTIDGRRGEETVSQIDARIITLWREVRRAGYAPADFPTDFIMTYVEAIAAIAPVEVGRFYDKLAGRIAQPDAAEMARAAIESLNALLGVLRIRAILDEVEKRSPPPS